MERSCSSPLAAPAAQLVSSDHLEKTVKRVACHRSWKPFQGPSVPSQSSPFAGWRATCSAQRARSPAASSLCHPAAGLCARTSGPKAWHIRLTLHAKASACSGAAPRVPPSVGLRGCCGALEATAVALAGAYSGGRQTPVVDHRGGSGGRHAGSKYIM